jgi:hypothetical protein
MRENNVVKPCPNDEVGGLKSLGSESNQLVPEYNGKGGNFCSNVRVFPLFATHCE